MRPDWDTYFLGIAQAASTRSDCERSKVGAVVVKDHRVRGTGYNGAPPGRPGCDTCPRRLSGCEPLSDYNTGPTRCVSIHAEMNAIIYSNRSEVPGSTIYITRAPCDGCLKLIQGAQIARVVWPDGELIP